MVTTFFLSPVMLTWLLLSFTPAAFSAKIYLCGDSTMAKSPNNVIQGPFMAFQHIRSSVPNLFIGWGEKIQPFVNIPIVNKAIGGRSARSYTVEGRFKAVAELVTAGDIVVIEFGHNDGGSLSKNDNGRTDCPGAGSETCKSTYNGKAVTVKTFQAYLTEAGNLFAAKGAKVVFSSMTPNNIWEGGSGAYTASRFTDSANAAAKAVGKGSTFVDHGLYTAKAYKALGATKVNAMYPQDHTHTNDAGAKVVAEAFAKAVLSAKDANLLQYMKSQEAGTY